MDLGSILIIFALLILVGLYISKPLLEQRNAHFTSRARPYDRELSTLLAEKERLLNTLQELDLDNRLGKIPEGEYPVQRSALVQQGASILRQIDQFEKSRIGEGAQLRLAQINRSEGEIVTSEGQAQMKTGSFVPKTAISGMDAEDELESLIASRQRMRESRSTGFCPKCGYAVKKTDRYCAHCGAVI